MFLGYCGDGKNGNSENWLSTSDLENLVVPTGLSASCSSIGHTKVEWDPAFDTIATHLIVERKTAAQEYEVVAEVEIDEGIFVDEVANGVVYTYRVQAIIKEGDAVQYVSEGYSTEDTAQTSSAGCSLIVDSENPSEV